MDNLKACPFCGEQIKDTALECPHCNKSFLENDTTDDLATNLYWNDFESEETPSQDLSDDPEKLIHNALSVKYEILSEIGRGGMAIIYKAVQKNLNREVALKVLPQQFTHDEEYLKRFHREAREVAKLNHPNIITVFDEGIEKNVHYLSMELLDGKDLEETLKDKHVFDVDEVVNIISPIAEALNYLHDKNLIHRDIKSSNIFIHQSTRPVLMDFGIARAAGKTKLTQAGTIMGTPEYMSPEQAEGKEIDSRSDLYSLGVVLYQCLTGVVPFKADNPITIIRKIVDEKPVNPRSLNAKIPKWLDEIVMSLLEKSPSNRIQNGNALSKSLINKTLIIGDYTSEESKKTIKIDAKEIKKSNFATPSNKEKPKRKPFLTFAIAIFLVAIGTYFFYTTMFRDTIKPNESKPSKEVSKVDTVSKKILEPVMVDSIQIEKKDSSNIISNDNVKKKIPIVEKSVTEIKESSKEIVKPKVDYDKIRRERIRKEINKLSIDLKAAKDLESISKKKFEHAKKMKAKNLLSPRDFKKAEEEYNKANSMVKQLKSQISQLKSKL